MNPKDRVLKKLLTYKDKLKSDTYQNALNHLSVILEDEDFSDKFTVHAERIFTTIAIYRALICELGNKDNALNYTSNLFHETWSKPARKSLLRFMKIPFFYLIFPAFVRRMVLKYYSIDSGFVPGEIRYNKGDFYYEVIKCPYYEYCKKYGYPELTEIFCDSDEICYQDLHEKMIFKRSKTISGGFDLCDFHYFIKK